MKFDYYKPSSVNEALFLKDYYKNDGAFLAGGTDLMIKMRMKGYRPKVLINIKNIKELQGIEDTGDYIRIGPLVKLSELEKSQILRDYIPILPKTALMMASPQVRNLGTVGGNLANAAPSADLAPPMIALDSEVLIMSNEGEEQVKLEDFFSGPGETLLGKEKLLKAILIPKTQSGFKILYRRHSLREAMDIAIISAAVGLAMKNGKINTSRIVLGAVAPIPLRVKKAEDILNDTNGNTHVIQRTAEVAMNEALPITDVRGSLEYRKEMVQVLIRRILTELIR